MEIAGLENVLLPCAGGPWLFWSNDPHTMWHKCKAWSTTKEKILPFDLRRQGADVLLCSSKDLYVMQWNECCSPSCTSMTKACWAGRNTSVVWFAEESRLRPFLIYSSYGLTGRAVSLPLNPILCGCDTGRLRLHFLSLGVHCRLFCASWCNEHVNPICTQGWEGLPSHVTTVFSRQAIPLCCHTYALYGRQKVKLAIHYTNFCKFLMIQTKIKALSAASYPTSFKLKTELAGQKFVCRNVSNQTQSLSGYLDSCGCRLS